MNQYTLWLDYSHNISLTEKCQVQSTHFLGKQHTLHNTIIQSPRNGEKKYVYHLPDDTNHDSIMTFEIIKDIITKHPEIIELKQLLWHSDNCQDQYKCKYTFQKMKELAKMYKIDIVWFYGEPRHDRGLVDAMSSFGCKQQLREEIVTYDNFFNTAEEMIKFLNDYFRNDNKKKKL